MRYLALLFGTAALLAHGAHAQTSGGGSGAVASVGLALPSFITVTGSPITRSGTLTGTLASETANLVFAAPAGSAGTPAFRTLVSGDLPNNTASSTPASGGSIPIANGVDTYDVLGSTALASLTITMPPAPVQNQIITLMFDTAVTALTLSPNSGQTIVGAPTSAAANGSSVFQYIGTVWKPRA